MLARTGALLAAAAALLAFLALALERIDYPFEIEWMEGGSLGHVERLRAGEALYASPSLEFTPFIYTPLYFEMSSWIAEWLGGGFAPLRAISLLASLVSFALVGCLVGRESGSRSAGLLAAGLLAATFEASGAWFDIARVDPLFLAFTLATVFVLRFGSSLPAGILAGALGACAFFTKQTTLTILAPFLLCAVFERSRFWVAFFGTLALGVAAGSVALEVGSDGWYSYYAFDLPRQHKIRWYKLLSFWSRDVMATMPVAAAAAVAFFAWRPLSASLPPEGPEGRRRLFYVCAAIGMIGSSFFSRLHSGGYLNVLMPAHAVLATFFGLGAAAFLRVFAQSQRPASELIVYGLCLLQFGILAYDPREQIPSEADRRAGEVLLERIRGIEGEVLVVYHGYLPGLAGKATSAEWMAVLDILRGHAGPERDRMRAEIETAIRERRYAAIILDEEWFPEVLDAHYELRGRLFQTEVFWPRTGERVRPEWLYLPKPAEGS